MSRSLPNDRQTAIRDIATRLEPALIEIRRDIHAHPELARIALGVQALSCAALRCAALPCPGPAVLMG